jgi:hypothetical protein
MLNKYLGQLLSDHHIEYSEVNGEYRVADRISISAEASIRGIKNGLRIQGDYILRVRYQTIIESFSISGTTEEEICRELTSYFAISDFHVMMSYVLGKEDDQNQYQEWDFNGIKRKMIIGPSVPRQSSFTQGIDLHLPDFYFWTKDYLSNLKVDNGLNWIRVFIRQINGKIEAAELLVKNSPIPDYIDYLREKPFTKVNGFYSYRNFMIVPEAENYREDDRILTPEEIARELLRIADENPNIAESELIGTIALHSKEPLDADLCYGFFQSGLLRRSMSGSGIPFNEDYWIADADGTIKVTGKLSDQTWYQVAFSVPEECITRNNINAIAQTSAEANMIRDAVSRGAKPELLHYGPVLQFISPPTERGLAKVLSLIKQQMGDQKKSWWKFW